MERWMVNLAVSFSLLLAIAGSAAAQATVEYGLGAGRAATTVAPSKGAGKAISGLADKLDTAVKGRQPGSAAEKPAAKTAPPTNSPSPPKPAWEDPSGISIGLSYADLVRRFGPPALEISGASGTSLTYSGKDGTFQIEVHDGNVTSIQKPKS